jgi:hypothetical protein
VTWILVDDAGRIVARGDDADAGEAAQRLTGGKLVTDVERRAIAYGVGGRVRAGRRSGCRGRRVTGAAGSCGVVGAAGSCGTGMSPPYSFARAFT